MIDVPVSVPFVPTGARPSMSERLGLGRVATRPESTRPVNDPEAVGPRRPSDEQARDGAVLGGEIGARVRLALEAGEHTAEPASTTSQTSGEARLSAALDPGPAAPTRGSFDAEA
ncbi:MULTISPECIES: hypothetical protein [Marichromatium]|uniref:Uncharacterized protein n=1 Tax=Marichromatium gracile TaxID=1048 RepID=A0A4R4A664_MARGR|nr:MULTISPECIES: hypothetical protein [Marichromatium]MBO8086364.1 hypothetical protein [Marichromatium sp.]MBK1708106.1 hypothetical protein [Marichromatium gracile]RNE89657.1 hypothetical protein EBL84_10810 [Marichromatium sp. AB31]RNE94735.1 hypothetical protein EBL85_00910 [Marichromatium sp. AB32]TCW33403.1 hypothetical protein EDC29_11450 [Marichromatium gracile]